MFCVERPDKSRRFCPVPPSPVLPWPPVSEDWEPSGTSPLKADKESSAFTHSTLTHSTLTHSTLTHSTLTHSTLTHSTLTHSTLTHQQNRISDLMCLRLSDLRRKLVSEAAARSKQLAATLPDTSSWQLRHAAPCHSSLEIQCGYHCHQRYIPAAFSTVGQQLFETYHVQSSHLIKRFC